MNGPYLERWRGALLADIAAANAEVVKETARLPCPPPTPHTALAACPVGAGEGAGRKNPGLHPRQGRTGAGAYVCVGVSVGVGVRACALCGCVCARPSCLYCWCPQRAPPARVTYMRRGCRGLQPAALQRKQQHAQTSECGTNVLAPLSLLPLAHCARGARSGAAHGQRVCSAAEPAGDACPPLAHHRLASPLHCRGCGHLPHPCWPQWLAPLHSSDLAPPLHPLHRRSCWPRRSASGRRRSWRRCACATCRWVREQEGGAHHVPCTTTPSSLPLRVQFEG